MRCYETFELSFQGEAPKEMCIRDRSGLARDLGDCLQSRNVPFGTSGDFVIYFMRKRIDTKG